MFDLLGVDMPPFAKFFIAFATVLILIGLTAWLVRRFSANRLGGANARGRQPRLAVIDAANVDGRRRLVLIRRDNVEHLLMIGGPSDLVVEPNIVRVTARDTGREPARPEPALRSQAPADNGWPLQPINEPAPLPPPPVITPTVAPPAATPRSTYRAAATEEPWLAPEPGARPRPSDGPSITSLATEFSARLQPPRAEPRPEPRAEVQRPEIRHEPPVRASAPPAAPVAPEPAAPETSAPQTDHNLAEMAQQLEAALRRAPMPESRPPVTDPLAVTPAKPNDMKSRVEPKFDIAAKPDSLAESPARVEPRIDVKPQSKPDTGAVAGKTVYDSLEEEMANLLGRPPGKT